MNLSEYREDPEKQKNGTPIYVGDSTFFVRRWGTPESLKMRKKLHQSLFGPFHKREDGDDALLLAHWLAEYGVTGWENVWNEAGEQVEYSVHTARDIFLAEGMELSLNDTLFTGAMNFENYLFDEAQESIEDIKKP